MHSEPTTPTPNSPVLPAEEFFKEPSELDLPITYEPMNKAPVTEHLLVNRRYSGPVTEKALDERFAELEANFKHALEENSRIFLSDVGASLQQYEEDLTKTLSDGAERCMAILDRTNKYMEESAKKQEASLARIRKNRIEYRAMVEADRIAKSKEEAKQQLTNARNKIAFNQTPLEFDKALEAIQVSVSRDKNAADSKWLERNNETGEVTHLNRWFGGPRPLSEALQESHPNGCTLNELYKFLKSWHVPVDPLILHKAVFSVLGLDDPPPQS